MSAIPLRLANGRVVAHVLDACLIVPVESRHYLAAGGGYSVDAAVLAHAIRLGASVLEFRHTKNRGRWRLEIKTFQENAKRFDYGFGPKLAAPEELYRTTGSPQVAS